MIRVLLAEDQAMVRGALAALPAAERREVGSGPGSEQAGMAFPAWVAHWQPGQH